MRTRYFRIARQAVAPPVSTRQLRNRACLPLEEGAAILEEILENATLGGVVIAPPLQQKFVERLGIQI